ncbi:MAG: N-acetyltransferase [Cytophagaceae bacterium]|nr:N-acetyltransferase [Gemmatimonadaceae bacterium]
MTDAITLNLSHNLAQSRYEAETTTGQVALCEYTRNGEVLSFNHVFTPPVLEGMGIGTRLVLFALDDVRAQGLTIIPRCPFVLAVIRKDLAYADLVVPHMRGLVTRSR